TPNAVARNARDAHGRSLRRLEWLASTQTRDVEAIPTRSTAARARHNGLTNDWRGSDGLERSKSVRSVESVQFCLSPFTRHRAAVHLFASTRSVTGVNIIRLHTLVPLENHGAERRQRDQCTSLDASRQLVAQTIHADVCHLEAHLVRPRIDQDDC